MTHRVTTITIMITEDAENIDVTVKAPGGATPADYLIAAARLVLALGGDDRFEQIGRTLMGLAGTSDFEVMVPQ